MTHPWFVGVHAGHPCFSADLSELQATYLHQVLERQATQESAGTLNGITECLDELAALGEATDGLRTRLHDLIAELACIYLCVGFREGLRAGREAPELFAAP